MWNLTKWMRDSTQEKLNKKFWLCKDIGKTAGNETAEYEAMESCISRHSQTEESNKNYS